LLPRFGVVREPELRLEWWEAILVGVAPFFALFSGLLDEKIIPVLPFGLIIILVAIVLGALYFNRGDNEPSILANITFSSPNTATFLIICAVFLITGALTATATTDGDSPLGVITYWVIVAAGSLWLPAASVIIGIRAYQEQRRI
jgi:hypothetical protein